MHDSRISRRYSDENVALLVEVDCLHDTSNGMPVKKLFERAWRVHGDLCYRRLTGKSASQSMHWRTVQAATTGVCGLFMRRHGATG